MVPVVRIVDNTVDKKLRVRKTPCAQRSAPMSIKPIQKKLSKRTQALLSHPQGMGNYFTFKSAIDILGLNWNDVAPGGVYAVTGKGYYDMGYMANHIGAPDSALKALREASTNPDV